MTANHPFDHNPPSPPRRTMSHSWLRESRASSYILIGFFVALLIPITMSFKFGTIEVRPLRLYMLAALPFILTQAFSNVRRVRVYDWLICAYLIWVFLCLSLRPAVDFVEQVGRLMIEAGLPYIFGRFALSNASEYKLVAKLMLAVVAISLLFAPLESISHHHILQELGTSLTGFHYGFQDVGRYRIRWGMARAMTFFEHPIHYGVFCATTVPFIWYLLKKRICYLPIPVIGVFFSLSSAAWMALFLNLSLIGAERFTRGIRNRAVLVSGSIVVLLISVEMFSKSGLFSVISRYMSFDAETAANRIRIWDYGLLTMYASPVFGSNPAEWLRLPWMSRSIDNHWVLTGIESGFPGLFLLLGGIGWLLLSLLRIPGRDLPPLSRGIKAGLVISIATLILTGLSVAYFGRMFSVLFLLIGLSGGVTDLFEGQARQLRRVRRYMRRLHHLESEMQSPFDLDRGMNEPKHV